MFIDCRDHFPARFALPFSNCSFLPGRPNATTLRYPASGSVASGSVALGSVGSDGAGAAAALGAGAKAADVMRLVERLEFCAKSGPVSTTCDVLPRAVAVTCHPRLRPKASELNCLFPGPTTFCAKFPRKAKK